MTYDREIINGAKPKDLNIPSDHIINSEDVALGEEGPEVATSFTGATVVYLVSEGESVVSRAIARFATRADSSWTGVEG